MDLPETPLWAGIGALALFNVYAGWRARRGEDVRDAVVFAHMLVDIVSLTWMVAWSGGVETPFRPCFCCHRALTLMIEDLANEATTEAAREEYATMKSLLLVCRDRVRELATPAETSTTGAVSASVELDRVIERWQLIRPAIELRRSGSAVGLEKVDTAVGA